MPVATAGGPADQQPIAGQGFGIEIVLRDRYGNLVSNLTPLDLEGDPAADLSRWRIRLGRRRIPLRRGRIRAGVPEIPIRGTYAEAASGELLALVDSYGALEIAVRDGSAADVLRLGPGAAISARRLR